MPESEWTPDAVAAHFADQRHVEGEGAAGRVRADAEIRRAGGRARGDQTLTDVAVIGAGPAGLMAAEVLAQAGARVTVYDAMPSAGRKFLMAGRGGLNLTHSEPLPQFLARYREAAPRLATRRSRLSGPIALRAWSAALGEPTFVGSSGRVFPKAFKASPLLRAWLRRSMPPACGLHFAIAWTGWEAKGDLGFRHPDGAGHRRRGHGARARRRKLAATGLRRRLGRTLSKERRNLALHPANCGFTSPGSPIFAIVSPARRSRPWR